MLKNLVKTTGLTAVAIALCPVMANAHSAEPKPFKEVSITMENHRDADTTVTVGHDGEKYTHIVNGQIIARFHLKAKVKSGHRVSGFVVTTGDPSNQEMLPDDLKGAEQQIFERKVDRFVNFTMDTETALSSGVWGLPPTTAENIVDKCNAAFSDIPENKQSLDPIELTIHAGFAARKRRGFGQAGGGWFADSDGRPGIAHTTLPLTITCLGFRRAVLPTPLPPRAAPRPVSVDLKVDQHGSACPKDVTVTTYADYKSPAKARMRMTVPGARPKFRFAKTRKVTFAGKTFHRAEAQFKYTLDPGQKTFKLTVDGKKGKTHTETVDIKCPPFKVTSAWLKYDVEQTPTCPKKVTETATFHTTRPGHVDHEVRMPGGLVVSKGKLTSKRVGDKYVATAVRKLTLNAIDTEFMADAVDYPANSGWTPLKVKCLDLKGDFSFVDTGAPKCPRTGKALITFKSNMPDNIHYSLDCTNGQHLSGFVKPVKQANGDYVAAAMKSFNIEKTSVYSCALKTVQPGAMKLHKWKGHTFNCVIPAVETGSNDLQVAPKPTDAQNRKERLEARKKRREAAKEAAAEKRRREAARKKAEAEKRRKAKIAAEKRRREAAKKKAEAEKRRREMLKKRLEAAREKNKNNSRRQAGARRTNTATASTARRRVMRLR